MWMRSSVGRVMSREPLRSAYAGTGFGSAAWVEDLGFEGVVVFYDVLVSLVGAMATDYGVISVVLF